MTRQCPQCGTPLGDIDSNCDICGWEEKTDFDWMKEITDLEEKLSVMSDVSCPSCGAPLEKGSESFCGICGWLEGDMEEVDELDPEKAGFDDLMESTLVTTDGRKAGEDSKPRVSAKDIDEIELDAMLSRATKRSKSDMKKVQEAKKQAEEEKAKKAKKAARAMKPPEKLDELLATTIHTTSGEMAKLDQEDTFSFAAGDEAQDIDIEETIEEMATEDDDVEDIFAEIDEAILEFDIPAEAEPEKEEVLFEVQKPVEAASSPTPVDETIDPVAVEVEVIPAPIAPEIETESTAALDALLAEEEVPTPKARPKAKPKMKPATAPLPIKSALKPKARPLPVSPKMKLPVRPKPAVKAKAPKPVAAKIKARPHTAPTPMPPLPGKGKTLPGPIPPIPGARKVTIQDTSFHKPTSIAVFGAGVALYIMPVVMPFYLLLNALFWVVASLFIIVGINIIHDQFISKAPLVPVTSRRGAARKGKPARTSGGAGVKPLPKAKSGKKPPKSPDSSSQKKSKSEALEEKPKTPTPSPKPKLKESSKSAPAPKPKLKESSKSTPAPKPKLKESSKPAPAPKPKLKESSKSTPAPKPKLKPSSKPVSVVEVEPEPEEKPSPKPELKKKRRDADRPTREEKKELGLEEEPLGILEEKSIIQFKCPICMTMVNEDASVCPGCGAIFED